MAKKTVFIILVCVLSLAVSGAGPTAYATQADLTITCQDKNECESDPHNQPLFTAENLQPSQPVLRSVSVKNKRKNDGCRLGIRGKNNAESSAEMLVAPDLTEVIQLDVYFQNQIIFTSALSEIFEEAPPLLVDILNPNTTKDYLWTAQIQATADNSYQGTTADFDFDLIFTCDESTREPTSSPTPVTTPKTISPAPTQKLAGRSESSGSVLGATSTATQNGTQNSTPPTRTLSQKITILALFIIISLLILFILFILLFRRKSKNKS